MNNLSNKNPDPISMEEGVNVLLRNARQGIRHRYHECEERVRKSPTTSVLGAVALGYFLRRLPVGSILATQVRVLSALTPPALVLFGAAKLCEFLQSTEHAKRK